MRMPPTRAAAGWQAARGGGASVSAFAFGASELSAAASEPADCNAKVRTAMSIEELTRNAAHVQPEGGLEAKLAQGRPLRVKLGIDVTAPQVTIGNGVPLQRMAAFQREGHVGV